MRTTPQMCLVRRVLSRLLEEKRVVYAARFGGLQSKTLSPFSIDCSGRKASPNATTICWRELMANIPPPPYESEGPLPEADASSYPRLTRVVRWRSLFSAHRPLIYGTATKRPARPPFHLTSSLFRPRFARPYESLHLLHKKVCESRRKCALFGGCCRGYSKRKEQYMRRGSAACRARRFRPLRRGSAACRARRFRPFR